MKLTERKRKALIKDEHKAAKEYSKLGIPSIARDERRHASILKKKKI